MLPPRAIKRGAWSQQLSSARRNELAIPTLLPMEIDRKQRVSNADVFQIDYILGKNPRRMSYVVGFGSHYPKHVHHRGASIPKNNVKYSCKGGWKWRNTSNPNPNTIVGAMVAGPDKFDGFHDVRTNYNYTRPTLAGNAGLVAALVALSAHHDAKTTSATVIDKNTIFSAIPPMFPTPPPPPAPWKP
ncbi:hypothetical protein HN51_063367 [Arachis hypogaea]